MIKISFIQSHRVFSIQYNHFPHLFLLLLPHLQQKFSMNTEDIQKFLDNKASIGNEYVNITFKNRVSVYGLFVSDHKDYAYLKAKNFWRIVPQSQFEAYHQLK